MFGERYTLEEYLFALLIVVSTVLYLLGGREYPFGGWVIRRVYNVLKFWLEFLTLFGGL
jgi:hypothetical protein